MKNIKGYQQPKPRLIQLGRSPKPTQVGHESHSQKHLQRTSDPGHEAATDGGIYPSEGQPRCRNRPPAAGPNFRDFKLPECVWFMATLHVLLQMWTCTYDPWLHITFQIEINRWAVSFSGSLFLLWWMGPNIPMGDENSTVGPHYNVVRVLLHPTNMFTGPVGKVTFLSENLAHWARPKHSKEKVSRIWNRNSFQVQQG